MPMDRAVSSGVNSPILLHAVVRCGVHALHGVCECVVVVCGWGEEASLEPVLRWSCPMSGRAGRCSLLTGSGSQPLLMPHPHTVPHRDSELACTLVWSWFPGAG
jgi:hypothetical protein